jgi:hypothetical protein
VLRVTFLLKGDEITQSWRRQLDEELHNWRSSPDTIAKISEGI